jgi:hypothetical protein
VENTATAGRGGPQFRGPFAAGSVEGLNPQRFGGFGYQGAAEKGD